MDMESNWLFSSLVAMIFVLGVGYAEVDYCITKCCGQHGGAVMELQDGNIGACNSQPGCMVVYAGSVKGSYDEACIAYTWSTNYDKESINRCIGVCRNENAVDYGPSPFIDDGYEPPEEIEKPTGPCANVQCPTICRDEGSIPTLYYDGQCIEGEEYDDGYTCGYVKGECVWECNSAGNGCNDRDPLQLNIQTPSENQRFDTGESGTSPVSVTGKVSVNPNYPISKVTVTSSIGAPQLASLDPSSGNFALDIQVPGGKPVKITAAAFDSSGRRLGKDTVTIYPSPKMMMLSFSKNSVTLYRNGQIISSDYTEGTNSYEAMEGDEFEISGDGEAYAKYSDGTLVIIKAPCKLRFYKKGIYLIKGAVEVNVKHDFTVLGRLGYNMVKGTQFKVIVPENENEPEYLIVMSGTVASALSEAPETEVYVSAGEHLYLYPGVIPTDWGVEAATSAELQSFSEGGEATFPVVSGDTPTGWSGGGEEGCCGTAFILMGALLGVIRFNRG